VLEVTTAIVPVKKPPAPPPPPPLPSPPPPPPATTRYSTEVTPDPATVTFNPVGNVYPLGLTTYPLLFAVDFKNEIGIILFSSRNIQLLQLR
jgi:hypothetical protein